MLLSALSFLVVAQSSSEVPEGLMNNPLYAHIYVRFLYTVRAYHVKREMLLGYEPNYKVK